MNTKEIELFNTVEEMKEYIKAINVHNLEGAFNEVVAVASSYYILQSTTSDTTGRFYISLKKA